MERNKKKFISRISIITIMDIMDKNWCFNEEISAEKKVMVFG